ncbi:MAG: DUF1049 domain-containing protein [Magnetococcales bacterium]|nr:DUF1049 domain-containing protein [Magnetococcales bacterium]
MAIVYLIIAIFVLAFASQNLMIVPVRFIFGPAVEIPLILVIVGAIIFGFALATLRLVTRRTRRFPRD